MDGGDVGWDMPAWDGGRCGVRGQDWWYIQERFEAVLCSNQTYGVDLELDLQLVGTGPIKKNVV